MKKTIFMDTAFKARAERPVFLPVKAFSPQGVLHSEQAGELLFGEAL